MKFAFIMLLGVSVVILFIGMIKKAGGPALASRSREGSEVDKYGDEVIRIVRTNIEKFGWHLALIRGSDYSPGFCFTIGLWETYNHPEIILFAAGSDAKGFAYGIQNLVKRIEAGEKVGDFDRIPQAFGKHDGSVRGVQPVYFSAFLGTAGRYYEHFNFEAIQLYWPDKKGLYPWQSGFEPSFLPFQPALFQRNLIVAGIDRESLDHIETFEGRKPFSESLDDLFVELPNPDAGSELLQSWRWLVGEEARLLKVTLFGDAFLKLPDGNILWLDCGSGDFAELAETEAEWLRVIAERPDLFFHLSVLHHARQLDFRPKEDEVYSWQQPMFVGGKPHVDNLSCVAMAVHFKHAGNYLQEVEKSESEPSNRSIEEDGVVYEVVIDEEQQFSIALVDTELPVGWTTVGKRGTKRECLEYITAFWQDKCPASFQGEQKKLKKQSD